MKRFSIIFLVFILIFTFSISSFASTVNVQETNLSYIYSAYFLPTDTFDSNLGWLCTFDVYFSNGHISNEFYLTEQLMKDIYTKKCFMHAVTKQHLYLVFLKDNINVVYACMSQKTNSSFYTSSYESNMMCNPSNTGLTYYAYNFNTNSFEATGLCHFGGFKGIDANALIWKNGDFNIQYNMFMDLNGNKLQGAYFPYRLFYCYLPILDNFNDKFKLWVGYFKEHTFNLEELGESPNKYAVFRNPKIMFELNDKTLNVGSDYFINFKDVDENGFVEINFANMLNPMQLASLCDYDLTLHATVDCDVYNTDNSSSYCVTQKFEYSAEYSFRSDGKSAYNITLSKDSANSDLPNHVGRGEWDNKNEENRTIWDNIRDFIVGIFVPEDSYWNDTYTDLSNTLNEKIPYRDYLDNLSNYTDINVEDSEAINVSIKLDSFKFGNQTLTLNKFIDFGIFSNFRQTWYTWVRVVLYLTLIIFNIHSLFKFLDSSMSVANNAVHLASDLSNNKNDKKK